MTSWQDLKDDLADEGLDPTATLVQVAHRVLALYQPCPDCEGTGHWRTEAEGVLVATGRCPNCGGDGLRPTAEYLALCHPDDWDVPVFYPYALARYLFGSAPANSTVRDGGPQ